MRRHTDPVLAFPCAVRQTIRVRHLREWRREIPAAPLKAPLSL
ncbi:hypothetical protein ASZ90_002653 [hydrocarbon metagenome]|uniref:Uncharacterized protein n=1 Tax=hydrocarbon metagenome TaxID=938273 RepID=A0A0W8G346_9ZZZZ